ncbi:bestrophin-4 [Fopius arisanus]|uniref:Bestrophin homolog n=2 Tax=Fopius arisanus TaxID=64838 RepID=A0A9R1SV51_9HYME|nr:PREDICTED: bestrophin-4 [Fopius arisanus]XP_011297702.1 PREDICTED: bestrophin-4 [Fopius arisanus]XP_011297703.1 PREDICTED: bestrophin-4 [Fopius arisanus]XP_011297704.1 PREDICTED: bestrophin-4 [Fopius arisanus]XP_011297705.1 PREDICTED: bestrophin-4 [Fopius arisanus]
MTVTYTAEVATCRGLGCFFKLLLRWRASVYKLVWLDLALFLFIYYSLSALYRFILDKEQQKTFEAVVAYCNEYSDLIPLSFVLGFYVSIVMTRWWNQYTAIPWPDSIAVFVSATIHGNDERGRLMRRTIVRYVCVCLTLVLANVSPRVKKRFPTLDHFVDAGLLLENELAIFQSLNSKFPKPSKHWLPIVWASSIVTRARKEGRIRDDFAVKTLIDELNKFRGNCGSLIHYDTISVPLVYTQVVTLAVYTYFLTSVMGRQWVHTSKVGANIDIYFPVFTTLQFFFYMGWLKVAETLINPFGEDDDDFEVNWIVDRNLQVSYLIVDEMHHDHPELIRDQYWDEIFPVELPYTAAAQAFREEHPVASTAGIQLSAAQQELQPSSVRIDEMNPESYPGMKFRGDIAEDAASGIHFMAGGKISRSASRVSNRDRPFTGGSTPSNLGGSLTRVNSVTSVLKRLFSKEDRPDGGSKTPGKLANSSSSASLQNRQGTNAGGSMRIGVIEEVDEQMTVNSMRPEHRPHVQTIFPTNGAPTPTAPMDVPSKPRNGDLYSASAPAGPFGGGKYQTRAQVSSDSARLSEAFDFGDDNVSIRSSETSTSSDDEFTRLKLERDRQRRDRAMRKLARSVSGTQQDPPSSMDLDETLLLTELGEASRASLRPADRSKDNETDNI